MAASVAALSRIPSPAALVALMAFLSKRGPALQPEAADAVLRRRDTAHGRRQVGRSRGDLRRFEASEAEQLRCAAFRDCESGAGTGRAALDCRPLGRYSDVLAAIRGPIGEATG